MEKKTQLLIGGGIVIGGLALYLHKSKGAAAEEGAPFYSGQAVPVEGAQSEGAGVKAAEERGEILAAGSRLESELGFSRELVTALEGRPSGAQEVMTAKETLEALGIPWGAGVSAPSNVQQSPSTTNSSQSESGSHAPTAPPSVVKSVAQALEAVPNSAHEWQLSTSGSTAGHYFYSGQYEGKPVHIYHWTGDPGFVGPHKNLVVV